MKGDPQLARATMVQAIQAWRTWVIGSLLSSDAELGAPIRIGA